MNFRALSIEQKLTLVVVATTAAALFLASSVLITRHALTTESQLVEDLDTLAQIVGNNSKAALSFGDAQDAAEVLDALKDKPNLLAACLYTTTGEILATYRSPQLETGFTFPDPGPDGEHRGEHNMILFRRVIQNNDAVGTLFFKADLIPLQTMIRRHITWATVMTLVSILLASLLASRLQHVILGQVNRVVDLAHAVAAGDLPEAIPVDREDEIGKLQQSFNQIVDTARDIVQQAQTLARGDYSITIKPRSSKDELSHALVKMTEALKSFHEQSENQNWLKSALSELHNRVRGEQDLGILNHDILSSLAGHLDAQIGSIFLTAEDRTLKYAAGYALRGGARCAPVFKFGEGLVGQAAESRSILFVKPPFDQPDLVISTGFVDLKPAEIALVPLIREHEVIGVLEMGKVTPFTHTQRELMRLAGETAAIAIHSAQARQKLNELLSRTQQQSFELQKQQGILQEQYVALEDRNVLLEQQKQEIHRKNRELEITRLDLERKARELELASQYKSEFLANVSHELRTPLNSLLILSRLLMENKDGNLSEKQTEFARTINKSGSDLLALINDILDLSKVEAGKMEFKIEEASVPDICAGLESTFRHVAEQKGLAFFIVLEPEAPRKIRTDVHRVNQILRNLLSNAFKFTHQGSVTVRVFRADRTEHPGSGDAIGFAVRDSGIGIPADKQAAVFSAFTQADGTTSREYGGTGLGLSISRELAIHMGGDITLQSGDAHGSTFTLVLPIECQLTAIAETPVLVNRAEAVGGRPPTIASASATDDSPGGDRPTILLIEDDARFAETTVDIARKAGWSCLIAATGEEGVKKAAERAPTGILLDVMLPDIDGHEVLRQLKEDPATRHIPVHVISALERDPQMIREGAIGFLTKPASKEQIEAALGRVRHIAGKQSRRLLIIEDNVDEANSVAGLIEHDEVGVSIVHTGRGALEELQKQKFDCIILDLGLTDMSGFDVLDRIVHERNGAYTPVIVHTGRDLTRAEESRLRENAESIIIKGEHSPERLLDRATLFLHLKATEDESVRNAVTVSSPPLTAPAPPPSPSPQPPKAAQEYPALKGKRVLIVDDDMRNAYSICAVLEPEGVENLVAADGRKALAKLAEDTRIHAVLMDIMMPGMDGYEAMREIRKQPRFQKLPIIAITAKAMAGDREKCIEAGANEYLPKPIDVDRLKLMLNKVLTTLS